MCTLNHKRQNNSLACIKTFIIFLFCTSMHYELLLKTCFSHNFVLEILLQCLDQGVMGPSATEAQGLIGVGKGR